MSFPYPPSKSAGRRYRRQVRDGVQRHLARAYIRSEHQLSVANRLLAESRAELARLQLQLGSTVPVVPMQVGAEEVIVEEVLEDAMAGLSLEGAGGGFKLELVEGRATSPKRLTKEEEEEQVKRLRRKAGKIRVDRKHKHGPPFDPRRRDGKGPGGTGAGQVV